MGVDRRAGEWPSHRQTRPWGVAWEFSADLLLPPKMASGDRKVSAVATAWPGGGTRRGILVASWGLAPYPEPLAALMGAGGACWPIGLRKKQGDPGPAVFIEDGGVLCPCG